jgi:HEAT repeat protein
VELVQLLLNAGANPNAKSRDGRSALHGAALQGGFETVQLLLNAGADPNAIDDRGQSPLHQAVMGDANPLIVDALLKAGAKTNITSQEGETPVRLAASRQQFKLYQMLLAASGGKEPLPSADPNLPSHGKSVAEMVKDLPTQDRQAQLQARRELASRGEKIVPELLEAMARSDRPEVFLELFYAMGPAAEIVLPTLEEMLGDQKYASFALLTIQQIRPGPLDQLSRKSRENAAQAIYESLVGLESAERSGIQNVMVPYQSVLLARLGEDVAAPYLVKLLHSDKLTQQYIGTKTLINVPFKDNQIQRELSRLARESQDRSVRTSALRALGRSGEANDELKQLLLSKLKNPPPDSDGDDDAERGRRNEWLQEADIAARSISRFGPDLIDDLFPLLSPLDRTERRPAMTAIQEMREAAVPRLVMLLEHDDDVVAHSAIALLGEVGRPAVPTLIDVLIKSEERVGNRAAVALQILGAGAKDALPALLGVTESDALSDHARLAAALAAVKIDPASGSSKSLHRAIPAILRVLEKGTFHQQGEAAEILAAIGPPARDALPLLKQRLEPPPQDTDTGGLVSDFVRSRAQAAIEAIGAMGQEELDD